jgi:anti-repressor protein
VFVRDGEVFADSRDVAAAFEKRHADTLRAVDDLCRMAPDLKLRDFTEATYPGERSSALSNVIRDYRCIHMTRDGFVLLAMGFNGERALKFKRAYIAAFNTQEALLRVRPATEPAIDVRNPKQLAVIAAQLIQVNEELTAKVEAAAPKAEFYDAFGLRKLDSAVKSANIAGTKGELQP